MLCTMQQSTPLNDRVVMKKKSCFDSLCGYHLINIKDFTGSYPVGIPSNEEP